MCGNQCAGPTKKRMLLLKRASGCLRVACPSPQPAVMLQPLHNVVKIDKAAGALLTIDQQHVGVECVCSFRYIQASLCFPGKDTRSSIIHLFGIV